jgi:hypothetical protein
MFFSDNICGLSKRQCREGIQSLEISIAETVNIFISSASSFHFRASALPTFPARSGVARSAGGAFVLLLRRKPPCIQKLEARL